jgi:hypothetical protein
MISSSQDEWTQGKSILCLSGGGPEKNDPVWDGLSQQFREKASAVEECVKRLGTKETPLDLINLSTVSAIPEGYPAPNCQHSEVLEHRRHKVVVVSSAGNLPSYINQNIRCQDFIGVAGNTVATYAAGGRGPWVGPTLQKSKDSSFMFYQSAKEGPKPLSDFLAYAPYEWLSLNWSGENQGWLISAKIKGTSFSAPAVAAALALRLGLERGKNAEAFKPLTIETAHQWLKKGAKYAIDFHSHQEAPKDSSGAIPVLNILGMVQDALSQQNPCMKEQESEKSEGNDFPPSKKRPHSAPSKTEPSKPKINFLEERESVLESVLEKEPPANVPRAPVVEEPESCLDWCCGLFGRRRQIPIHPGN